MATIVPPPSKRQRREDLERSQVQQDVTAVAPEDIGSFKARFVDGDGKQMTDVIEIPIADATEKNVSLLLNTLLGRVRTSPLTLFLDPVANRRVLSDGRTEKITHRTDFVFTFLHPTQYSMDIRHSHQISWHFFANMA
jgi:hypothetical protein